MLKNIFRNLMLTLLGKRRHMQRPDVLDVMFEHPELSLRQADWIVNGRKRLLIRLVYLLLIFAIAARWYFS